MDNGDVTQVAAATPDQPVPAAERLVSLDFIRGVAVLGILFANITAFGQPYMAYFWPEALTEPATAGDKNVWLFQTIFIDHKFRGLFSLLFGAGIYLFMERAWARGSGRWLQFRRLAFLALFGLIHYFLIWRGDILTAYAVTGMIALACVRWSARTQLVTGLCLYVFGFLLMVLMMGGQLAMAKMPELAGQADPAAIAQIEAAPRDALTSAAEEVELFREGSYPQIVEKVVTEDAGQLVTEVLLVPLTETLALVLIGMALYRMGFFSGAFDRAKMRRWGWIGIVAGVLVTIPLALWPYRTGFDFFTTLFVFNAVGRIGQLPMALGLAALLVLWAPSAAKGWLGSRFAAAGRMAFSNYLGTSIIMMFVFHGWALGLFGYLGRVELFGVVVVTWIAMLAQSKAWLARFRYGPLEWLWRCLTYGKMFEIRRS
ncbi:MAG: DUF418 domain-containing protein [Croceibacterium sp.]